MYGASVLVQLCRVTPRAGSTRCIHTAPRDPRFALQTRPSLRKTRTGSTTRHVDQKHVQTTRPQGTHRPESQGLWTKRLGGLGPRSHGVWRPGGGGHWRVRDHNVTPNMTNIRSLGGTRVFFLGGGGGDEGSPPGSNSGSALPGFWSFTCIFVPCEYCEGEQKEKQVLLHTSVCFMQGQCTMLLSRNYSQTARTEAT